jgi:DNA adenine methylase
MPSASPLRYPGGKQALAAVLASLIRLNGAEDGVYAEPYAGGAGAALSLLFSGYVRKLLLNDVDPCIFCMWDSILRRNEEFLAALNEVPLTVAEWKKQKHIYSSPEGYSALDVGFATFFLNRTNRSGIIKNAGPIGGMDQSGPWKIDARFNRDELSARIERIGRYRSRINFTNLDALSFMQEIVPEGSFVYLDPPYFVKGRELYLNHYTAKDHKALAERLRGERRIKWVMSYDATDEIRKLYSSFRTLAFTLTYTARSRRSGSELLIFGKDLKRPSGWASRFPVELLRNAS